MMTNRKEDTFEDMKSEMADIVNAPLKMNLNASNLSIHLQMADHTINTLGFQMTETLNKIDRMIEEANFELEDSTHHASIFGKITMQRELDSLEEAKRLAAMCLLTMNFCKKEFRKLIEYYQFYGAEIQTTEPEIDEQEMDDVEEENDADRKAIAPIKK